MKIKEIVVTASINETIRFTINGTLIDQRPEASLVELANFIEMKVIEEIRKYLDQNNMRGIDYQIRIVKESD